MDFNKLKVSVIGCGWLGLPLCETLLKLGYKLITTTTNHDKKDRLLGKFNIQLLDINSGVVDESLLDCDILIYTIPPLGLNEVDFFFKSIRQDQKIIFISSTSVYGKNQGKTCEESAFDPESKNALALRNSENFLKMHFKNVSVIRPGGLYGDKRHPVYFLAGKTGISTGEELLHLVHRDDCVNAITKIIELDLVGEDFNLVSDLRILKKDYYTEMAINLGLTPPTFEGFAEPTPTNIVNDKSRLKLGLKYQDPNKYL